MTASSFLPARHMGALLSSRVDRTIFVQKGQLNVILGERIVRLSAGESLTINRGTLHALANLSLSPVVIEDDAHGMAEMTVFAAANGEVYATHRSCVLQVTLSLYARLRNDLNLPEAEELRKAA